MSQPPRSSRSNQLAAPPAPGKGPERHLRPSLPHLEALSPYPARQQKLIHQAHPSAFFFLLTFGIFHFLAESGSRVCKDLLFILWGFQMHNPECKNDVKWSNKMALGTQREWFYLMGWRG